MVSGIVGLFRWRLSKGETSLTALRRELIEELELSFVKYEFVSRLEFDLRPMKLGNYFREYYLVEPTEKNYRAWYCMKAKT